MAQCEFCGRTFARNEHLIRHQRIHTGERPFHCPHCQAGFQRPDVLAKHMEKLHRQHDGTSPGTSASQRSSERNPRDRERSRLACDQCRKRKLKCDNVRPCRSCQSKLLTCTVSSSSRPPGRPRNIDITPVSPAEQYSTTTQSGSLTEDRGEMDHVDMVDPLLGQWTPNSMEPPPAIVAAHSSETANATAITAAGDTYYNPAGSLIANGEQWLHASTAAPAIPAIQIPFDVGAAYLQQTWETMDFFDDIVPSADFGNWLEDLNEFSMSRVYDIWPQTSIATALDVDLDPSMDNAIDMMKDQLQRRSRASSPSREAQRWSWYSALPQLNVYDEEMLNILLNVSKRHISSTFAIFADFEAGPDTRVELCLAMAAVGGLYSTTPDSTKIAKMLFNDARRLMLEDYLQHGGHTFDDYLSFAKTFVLLEIYGLCSGDKRAFEFMEVFHGSKVHAASSCINALPLEADASQKKHIKLLAEAMHVLDSYRVLLMQRPPSFIGDRDSQPLVGQQHNPGSNSANNLDYTGGGVTLASTIRQCWMASPRDADGCPLRRLWSVEFVQLALDRWLQSSTETDPSGPLGTPQMLLYHLAQASLQSNMAVLHRLTQAAAQCESKAQRVEALNDPVQPWASRRHFEVSRWHARAILRIAHDEMVPQPLPRRHTLTGSTNREKTQIVEPPHLPLCVYFATLVVWVGVVKSEEHGGSSGDDLIETSSQLLFRLRVPMAKFLGTALCELLASGSSDGGKEEDTIHVIDDRHATDAGC